MTVFSASGSPWKRFRVLFRDFRAILRTFTDDLPDFGDLEELPEPPAAPGPMTADQMKNLVATYAQEHEDFSRQWDCAVQMAADALAGRIAGARMAGATSGSIIWDSAHVPQAAELDVHMVRQVFCMSVYAEVDRRMNTMSGPGAFG